MKFSEVDKNDCKVLADLINSLRAAKLPEASLVQMVNFVDGLRWLQDVAQGMARTYAEESKPPEVKKKEEGFTIKSYVPGVVE